MWNASSKRSTRPAQHRRGNGVLLSMQQLTAYCRCLPGLLLNANPADLRDCCCESITPFSSTSPCGHRFLGYSFLPPRITYATLQAPPALSSCDRCCTRASSKHLQSVGPVAPTTAGHDAANLNFRHSTASQDIPRHPPPPTSFSGQHCPTAAPTPSPVA
jgi:hypothetical protein